MTVTMTLIWVAAAMPKVRRIADYFRPGGCHYDTTVAGKVTMKEADSTHF